MEEIKPELIDELLKGYQKPEDLIGENGLLKQLTKAVLERRVECGVDASLGIRETRSGWAQQRQLAEWTSAKTIKGNFGELMLETPRDRKGTFEPQIVGKHQTRFDGFDDKILSLYARGMSTREIQGHLKEIYGVEVSPTLISDVTDAVLEEVKAWQSRPLEPIYA